ncbi:MAG: hypothetical protein K2O59_06640 [Lachnospiraceae bacterium]|nr:hypothetical protein [Lachnospiraceae bacterium]
MLIEEKYKHVLSEYGFTELNSAVNVNYLVKDALASYVSSCKKPALWCYGRHTKMLMADFMSELRSVKYIIDERADEYKGDSGFQVINKREIIDNEIDGIIISSYKFREEIRQILIRDYPDVSYLDIYEYMENQGVYLDREYYDLLHPYSRYIRINDLQLQLAEVGKNQEEIYVQLIGCFIEIKDFYLAVSFSKELYQLFPKAKYKRLIHDLQDIYELECEMCSNISEENVLILCIDGLRNKDISEREMPVFKEFSKRFYRYENAYSVSTSTYESLVPVFSENADMRTMYYVNNSVNDKECRFIQKAYEQKRVLTFNTDGARFIESEKIHNVESYQTASEKIWNFILDTYDEKNALYYLHILFESHYSYPNPYIKTPIIAEGSNIIFDFMQSNGGKIRTNYEMQHHAMLKYLDDAIIPILQKVKCRMVIFADHGNIIVGQQERLDTLQPLLFTYHQDLVRIPLMIKSPEMGEGVELEDISLMELNTMIISLLEKKKFERKYGNLVKIQRSEIYNPDFKFLYEKRGYRQGLLAFEVFLFDGKYKLGIFSNGQTELISTEDDESVKNEILKKQMFDQIKEYITVCSLESIDL